MKTLGIFVGNWLSWQGGVSYVRSFLRCASEYRHAKGSRFKIVAVVPEKTDCAWLYENGGLVDEVLVDVAGALSPRQMLPERIVAKLFPQKFPRRDISRAAFCRRNNLDVLFGCSGSISVRGFYRSAAYIWDLGHRLAPGEFPLEECEQRDKFFRDICFSHHVVIVSSKHDAIALRALFPDAPAKFVVHSFRSFIGESELCDDPSSVASEFGLPRKYAIVCNQMWKHKRHDLLVRAVADLQTRLPEICVVFTGAEKTQYHPSYPQSVVRLIRELRTGSGVVRLGVVPRSQQLALLRGAAFIVQPSVSEGWNTGVEEAHMLGKNVLMSDIPVHLEQFYEGCRVFKKDDIGSLINELESMWRLSQPGPGANEESSKSAYAELRYVATGNVLNQLGVIK